MPKFISIGMCILFLCFTGGALMGFEIPEPIQKMINEGEYAKAKGALKSLAEKQGITEKEREEILFEAERLRRVPRDFRLSEEDVLKSLKEDIPDASMDDVTSWTKSGALESRIIDGKRLYFNRAVRNLFILNKDAARRRVKTAEKETSTTAAGEIKDMRIHAQRAIEARQKSKSPLVTPKRFRIEYTLSVHPGAVPEGEIIRCWLPYPKGVPTQSNIALLDSFPGEPVIAPNKMPQRTIYMERPAQKDKPTTFSVTYQYTAWAFVQPVDPRKVEPYNKKEDVYTSYTAERPPHITFTPEIRKLAKEICGKEKNPYLRAKKIFAWVYENITWSGAIEYSIVPNLSMRALERRTGDCGMQGLLFITLCRASGIPARWQSGWSLAPGVENMHDWTQVYFEPYGWLYADPSRGLMDSKNPDVKWFNFGNFDCYRLIVNTDYGCELYPKKNHFRSEPEDFQRGEVEWKGGNLYFDQWDYIFKVVPMSK
ncbi:MAG: transglutaminase-like domain-containing protein [Candidatus Sumerlaeota bacterium]|nr:transglutaminase-like domain-containing protein [Candidatus Sumerlaeota bacterium]